MKKLLALRKEQKAKQPKFTRHASHRKKKLKDGVWRRPKGLHNKLRLRKRSRGSPVKNGYRGPEAVRGLSPSGKKTFLVRTINDIHNAEPELHALIIAKVGDRRRLELLKEATEQEFEVLNIDAKARTDLITKRVTARGKKRDVRTKKREALAAEADKKAAKKTEKADKDAAKAEKAAKKTPPAESEEEKVSQKKQQDKVLTKKENNN